MFLENVFFPCAKKQHFTKLIFTKKDQKKTKKSANIVYYKLFYPKKSKTLFFSMLKKRAFCRGSLFLVKTAKKREIYFVQKDLKTPKIPKKCYKTTQKPSFYIKNEQKLKTFLCVFVSLKSARPRQS